MTKEKEIIDLKIYKKNFSSLDIYRNIEILYVLKGNTEIEIEGEAYKAKEEDIIVVNFNENFKAKVEEGSIIVCLILNHLKFNKLINNNNCSFMCNSIIENSENYEILRNKIKVILNKNIDTGQYKNIYLQKLYYELLLFLINNFCNKVISSESSDNSRLNSILHYIEDNYKEPLMLRAVAHEFFLTPEYFAKYFKESVGMTFLKYLNNVRIKYAMEDLINSDNTILEVALDNGFPNVASFNKNFKEMHHLSPAVYRKKNKKQNEDMNEVSVAEVLENITFNEDDEKDYKNIDIDAADERILSEYWKEVIGIGSVELLCDCNVQEQVITIKEQLGFKYLRVIFDSNKYINNLNIYSIEKAFDFLLSKKFKLFIAFEYRIIDDKDKFLSYVRHVITKCANRYSINVIRSWKFELFYDCDFEDIKGDRYFEVFKELSKILREFAIETDLMGPGLLLNMGGKNLDNYLKKYKEHNIKSSIITLSSVPCSLEKTENAVFINRSTDRYYMKNQLDLAHKIIKGNNMSFDKVVISKWIDSLANNNIINDSCYEGANIVSNILSCYGKVDAICYYQSLDTFCDLCNTNEVLSGLPGLLSKDGIKKPSYYSYRFLNHIFAKYIYQDDHAIIGVNDMKNYQIVCHNCKKLNYKYFTEDENKLKVEKIDEYYDDKEKLTLRFKLNNVRNGKYLIKFRKINETTGSVQDEIKNLKSGDIEIGPSEVEYLKSISIPNIKLEKKLVEEKILEFKYTLEPNEISYIHIIYEY